MPTHFGKDKKGCFAQWGSKAKYHYECGNKEARARAKVKADKQGKAAYAAGYKGNDMLQRITANFTGNIRHDTMMGRDYIVAPMSMLTEGVHEGSGGALLYPKEELFLIPQIWNHKPVVVYHPIVNGEGVSACDPIILSNRQVGVIMNARKGEVIVNNKKVPALLAEAWLEPDRMNKVDERISQAIEKNEMMELSTGLFTDNETAEENAEWNGEKYDAIARHYRPDHLALLPDLKGACSIEDGAGFLRLNAKPGKINITGNEMSHSNIRSLLNSWLQDENENAWIDAVYDDFFVYEDGAKYYKYNYSLVDNQITITGSAEEVIRITEWRTLSGEFVGNKDKKEVSVKTENDSSINRKVEIMDDKKKVKIIDALIACNTNSWGKDDRETLEAMEDNVLEKMLEGTIAAEKAVENAAKKGAEEATASLTVNQDDKEKPAEEKPAEEKPAEEKPTGNQKPQTAEEFIAGAPKDIRPALNGMMVNYKALKANLVKKITDNEKNIFTKEELDEKDMPELKKLAALLPGKKESPDNLEMNDFGGLEEVEEITENTVETMVMPPVVNAVKK